MSDWLDGSRKFRKDGREGNEGGWELGAGVGEALGILGMECLSFFGSISLLTHERIFSLSSLSHDNQSCDDHVILINYNDVPTL